MLRILLLGEDSGVFSSVGFVIVLSGIHLEDSSLCFRLGGKEKPINSESRSRVCEG